MKLALMQPYFFPYIGYFTLVGAVDRFVFYDDVQYIKNGWINRNRVLIAGKPAYITVPLLNASASSRIDEVVIAPQGHWKRKMLESLRHAYGNAPCFDPVHELVRSVLVPDVQRICELAKASVYAVARYLEVGAEFVHSSSGYANRDLRGVGRVLDICRREGASEYVNLPGGRDLYDAAEFAAAGVHLRFVDAPATAYRQFGEPFQPNLSIIDVLMHNRPAQVRTMLASGVPA
jgi:hypothetical protein